MPLNVQKVKWGHVVSGPAGSHAGAAPASHARKDPDLAFAEWILSPPADVMPRSLRPGLQAVLFDLDGVLVDTAEFHYRAWQRLADELGIFFDREINHGFRGVGRTECLEKLLGEHAPAFAPEERRLLADRKNGYYLDQVKTLTAADVAPGTRQLIAALRGLPASHGVGVRLAVVSASKNAKLVLELLHIAPLFDAIIDGNDTTRSKPDPEGFLLAANRLRVSPEHCVVVEDAEAGVRAARAANMKAVAVGTAANAGGLAHLCVEGLMGMTAEGIEKLAQSGH